MRECPIVRPRAALGPWLATVGLALVSCGPTKARPPMRPDRVPIEASWAGGTDGGDWLHCRFGGKEPAAFFDCTVYSDQTGDVVAHGLYVLGTRGASGDLAPTSSLTPKLDYRYFDGVSIHLQGGYALLPEGDIDHPVGDGHGKVTTYKLGRERGERSY